MPKKAGETRPRQINIRVTENLYRALTLVAAVEDTDRAEVARQAIEKAVQGRVNSVAWRRRYRQSHGELLGLLDDDEV